MTMRLPEDVRRHLRAACKENLLAVRAFLDFLLRRLTPEAPPPERRPRRERAPSERAARPRPPRRRRRPPSTPPPEGQ